MIKLIVLSVLLNTGDSNIYATVPTEKPRIERSRRNKGNKKRKRGGNGLR